MANYATLKAAIVAAIRENGNNEITAILLQQQLLAMVNSLGVGYQLAGIATPSTNPGTPDQNVFYIASTAGTYVNFTGLVLDDGEIAILKYNGAWSKETIASMSNERITTYYTPTMLGYIDTSGVFISGDYGHYSTDYISVKSGEAIRISPNVTVGGSAIKCAYYNSSKVFVSSLENGAIIAADGYVRFCGQGGLQDNPFGVDSEIDLEQMSADIEQLKQDVAELKEQTERTITYYTPTLQGYINTSGVFVEGDYGHYSTDYISVKTDDVILISPNVTVGGLAIKCAYYNSSKVFVSSLENGATILADGYIRFCGEGGLQDNPFGIESEIDLGQMSADIEQLKQDVAELKGEAGRVTIYYTPNMLGYIDTSGVFHEGDFGAHYSTDYISVKTDDVILISSNVTVGGSAIKCAYYNSGKVFVSSLENGAIIAADGYVRFCGQGGLQDNPFGIEKDGSEIIDDVTNELINNKTGSVGTRMIDNVIADYGLPSWVGKIELRTTDPMPSINNAGMAYIIDNNGTLELRVIKDAINIVGCALTQKLANVVTPKTFGMCHFGDSITYGVGANPNYVTRLKTLLETDGHTISLQTNLGISGITAEGVYNTYKNTTPVHHDVATYMIGINDQDRWLTVKNTSWRTDGLKPEKFREWFRENLRLSIDAIIRYSTCNKLFLIVPYWSVVEMRNGSPYPSESAYYSQPLQNVVIQEYIDAAKDYNAYLCRADYYVPNSYAYVPDGLHANNDGAQLLAQGLRNEITFRV